jgi:glycosyltransferase involved in cell wall biosynthesis
MNKKLKIIHVAQFLGIGGLEKIIFNLALEQQSLGHEVSVYIYDYERTWVPYFRECGIRVITPALKKKGYDFGLLLKMNNDLFDYDIIHTHDLNPLMYLGPLFFWKKCIFQNKSRLIHTTHGLDHLENYPRSKFYEKLFTHFADKIVGVSERIGHFYKSETFLNKDDVHIIQNGISTYKGVVTEELRKLKREWICKKHNLDSNRPIILSLSRIVPLKDQNFLIECLKKNNVDYQLLVAGPPSDPQYFNLIKANADQNTHFIGAQELVEDYNLGVDLYVSASTHEGIPVAVLEAMAVETPCLVSNIPGHSTLNQEGTFVELFHLKDQDDFLNRIKLLINENDFFKARAKLGRNIVESHFSVNKMVAHYLEVYLSSF